VASTCDNPGGFLATTAAPIATFSQYVPSRPASNTPKTSSPTRRSVTPEPMALTTPERSRPRITGKVGLAYSPAHTFQSAPFTLAAWVSTTTWPGPGVGSGRSPYFRFSGPPNFSMYAAFMGALLFASRSWPRPVQQAKGQVRGKGDVRETEDGRRVDRPRRPAHALSKQEETW